MSLKSANQRNSYHEIMCGKYVYNTNVQYYNRFGLTVQPPFTMLCLVHAFHMPSEGVLSMAIWNCIGFMARRRYPTV